MLQLEVSLVPVPSSDPQSGLAKLDSFDLLPFQWSYAPQPPHMLLLPAMPSHPVSTCGSSERPHLSLQIHND